MLVGVTSMGPESCGEPLFPAVFTRVSPFRSWLDSVIQEPYKKSNGTSAMFEPATTTEPTPNPDETAPVKPSPSPSPQTNSTHAAEEPAEETPVEIAIQEAAEDAVEKSASSLGVGVIVALLILGVVAGLLIGAALMWSWLTVRKQKLSTEPVEAARRPSQDISDANAAETGEVANTDSSAPAVDGVRRDE